MLTPKRIYQEEMLDAGEGTDQDVAHSLSDLRRINRLLGGRRVIMRALSSFLDGANHQKISLLAVGTGSADMPMEVAAGCRARGVESFIGAGNISERKLR